MSNDDFSDDPQAHLQGHGEEEIRASFVEPGITIDDFKGWLIGKQSQTTAPLGLLLQQAVISINRLIDAADRWEQLEYHGLPSSPVWLNRLEAQRVVKGLAGDRSVEAKHLRREIKEMFEL